MADACNCDFVADPPGIPHRSWCATLGPAAVDTAAIRAAHVPDPGSPFIAVCRACREAAASGDVPGWPCIHLAYCDVLDGALAGRAEAERQRDAARGLAAALEAELARVREAVNVGATPALIAEILDEATDG